MLIERKIIVKMVIIILMNAIMLVAITGCSFFHNSAAPPTPDNQQPNYEQQESNDNLGDTEQNQGVQLEGENGSETEQVELVNIVELALDFQVQYSARREQYRNDDGVKLLELYTVYPEVISTNNQKTADKINNYFLENAIYFIEETQHISLSQAEDDYLVKSDLGFEFQTHYYERVASFYYQDEEQLIFLVQDYYNHGGPRPLIINEAAAVSVVNGELVIVKQELKTEKISEQLPVASEVRDRVELDQEYLQAAVRLLDNNLDMVMNIYYLDMLPMEIPESGIPLDNLVLVKHPYLKSFTDLEAYVKSTYAQEQAELLLNDGRYLGIYGRLYADISKLAGVGYYTDLFNYQFKLEGIQKNSAKLTIMTIEDSPMGIEEVEIRTKILREQGRLVLNNMLY